MLNKNGLVCFIIFVVSLSRVYGMEEESKNDKQVTSDLFISCIKGVKINPIAPNHNFSQQNMQNNNNINQYQQNVNIFKSLLLSNPFTSRPAYKKITQNENKLNLNNTKTDNLKSSQEELAHKLPQNENILTKKKSSLDDYPLNAFYGINADKVDWTLLFGEANNKKNEKEVNSIQLPSKIEQMNIDPMEQSCINNVYIPKKDHVGMSEDEGQEEMANQIKFTIWRDFYNSENDKKDNKENKGLNYNNFILPIFNNDKIDQRTIITRLQCILKKNISNDLDGLFFPKAEDVSICQFLLNEKKALMGKWAQADRYYEFTEEVKKKISELFDYIASNKNISNLENSIGDHLGIFYDKNAPDNSDSNELIEKILESFRELISFLKKQKELPGKFQLQEKSQLIEEEEDPIVKQLNLFSDEIESLARFCSGCKSSYVGQKCLCSEENEQNWANFYGNYEKQIKNFFTNSIALKKYLQKIIKSKQHEIFFIENENDFPYLNSNAQYKILLMPIGVNNQQFINIQVVEKEGMDVHEKFSEQAKSVHEKFSEEKIEAPKVESEKIMKDELMFILKSYQGNADLKSFLNNGLIPRLESNQLSANGLLKRLISICVSSMYDDKDNLSTIISANEAFSVDIAKIKATLKTIDDKEESGGELFTLSDLKTVLNACDFFKKQENIDEIHKWLEAYDFPAWLKKKLELEVNFEQDLGCVIGGCLLNFIEAHEYKNQLSVNDFSAIKKIIEKPKKGGYQLNDLRILTGLCEKIEQIKQKLLNDPDYLEKSRKDDVKDPLEEAHVDNPMEQTFQN